MRRRRLSIYAVCYVSGIIAANLYFEMGARICAILFVMSCVSVMWYVTYDYDSSHGLGEDEFKVVIIVFIVGAIVFTVAHHQLDADEYTCETDGKITGTVTQVSESSDKVEYVVIAEISGGRRRILAREYNERLQANYESDSLKDLEENGAVGGNNQKGTLEETVDAGKSNTAGEETVDAGKSNTTGEETVDAEKSKTTRKVYAVGDILVIKGKVSVPDSARNPRCFDYRRYLKSKHIVYTCTIKGVDSVGRDTSIRFTLLRMLDMCKRSYLKCFENNDVTYGFVKGALFGDKSSIDEDIYEEFASNGTAHILAVSGLHVGFILMMLNYCIRRRKSKLITALMIGVLIAYGFVTAWSAATQRAVMIAVIAMLSIYLKRPFDLTSALSASVIVFMTLSPYQIYNSGYIMSYLAMYGIAFLAEPMENYVGSKFGGLLAIQVGMLPYTCYMYNHINLMTILINIPIVLLASVMIPLYIIGFAINTITHFTPNIVISCIHGLTNLVIYLNRKMYVGGAFDNVMTLDNILIVITAYVLIVVLSSELYKVMTIRKANHLIVRLVAFIMIPICITSYGMRNRFANDEIVFIDVGQGDAIHAKTTGMDLLFDGGGSANYDIGKKTLKPYFAKNGASDVDVVISTHLHMDHFLASKQLEECYLVKRRIAPAICEGSSELNGNEMLVSAGDKIPIDDNVWVQVLWPLEEAGHSNKSISGNDNELNAVYMLHYNDIKVMITGDLLEADEHSMIQYYAGTNVLQCDVLKIAHHGSHSSTSDEFLDATNPDVAVIQVGKNNLYGHPAPETIDKLTQRNIAIYRTDEDGAIGIDVSSKAIAKLTGVRMRIDKMLE